MNAYVVCFVDPTLYHYDHYISCVSSLIEAEASMLSFVCTSADLDFSAGFCVRVFVDGVFDRTIYYSYDPIEDSVSEVG